ncbi:MAG: RecT family recombinase [bacterium]
MEEINLEEVTVEETVEEVNEVEEVVEKPKKRKTKKTKTEETDEVDNKELAVRTAEQLNLVLPKNIADKVLNSLITNEASGRMNFPSNYNVGNAIKSAYLKLSTDRNLNACTDESKANAMLQMAILGLSPAKTQCYFVALGGQATLMPSYFGKVCSLKRVKGVKEVRADVIYKGTEYDLTTDEYGNDDIIINKPCPLDQRDGKEIIGAWAKIFFENGTHFCSLLTMQDIENSWGMGHAKGNSKAHQNFRAEMAKKSAINRAAKMFINTCDDYDSFIETYNDVLSNEYQEVNNSNGNSETLKPKKVVMPTVEKEVIEPEVIDVVVVEKNNKVEEEEIDISIDIDDLGF